MRSLILCVAIVLSTNVALANDWGFNQIVSYVNLAEQRLKEGLPDNARKFLEQAREMMPNASADAKKDKGWPALEQRMAKLDKEIAAAAQGAATITAANEKLNEAASEEIQARFRIQNDDFEEAAKTYDHCTALLEEAAKIDPSVKSRASNAEKTWSQLQTICKEGKVKMVKEASGDGRNVMDTELGKTLLETYQTASKAMAAKKPQALEHAAGIGAAEKCSHTANHLGSIQMRNGKPMWDGQKTKIDGVALDEIKKSCSQWERDLKAKPAFGCGRQYVGVSQRRPSIVDRWRPAELDTGAAYEAMDCKNMPKKSVFPGLSATYKGKLQKGCGADAFYIMQHARWLESALQRQISGECWKKGNLKLHFVSR